MGQRTDEQAAADRDLEHAIERAARAYGRIPEHSTVVSFITVVEALTFDNDGDVSGEHHTLLLPHGGERLSVAKGNLQIGLDIIVADDEEDDD